MLIVAISMSAAPVKGTYTTRTVSDDYLTSTWTFDIVSGSSVDVKAETTDNELVLIATSSAKIKMQTTNYVSFNQNTEVYIPVPSGSAGNISIAMSAYNDSRYFQLYVAGVQGTEGQRLYSKLNAGGITSDGKKGPQTFSFTSSDITTKGGLTYLHFKSDIGEMKVASFTVTLTTGSYANGPVDPVLTVSKESIGMDETAKILLGGKDNFSDYFTAGTLYESAEGGPYITLGADGTITPVKETPDGYYFTFTATSKDADTYNTKTENRIDFTVTAPVVATPVITPASKNFTESVTVTATTETDGATLYYSTDDGATWTALPAEGLDVTVTTTVKVKASKTDYTDSEVATATYTKVEFVEQSKVEAATTWDWTKFGTTTIQLTDATDPKKNEEFVLQNVVAYGYCESIGADFNAQALKVIAEYPVRDGGYTQANSIKFNTTVPGTVSVTFSNTGKDRPYRYLRVQDGNGTTTYSAEGSATSSAITSEAIAVSAGEVTIDGYILDANNPKAAKDNNVGPAMIRVSKIVFTPLPTATIEINAEYGVRTYVTEGNLDFSLADGIEAYIVTGVDTKVRTQQVTQAPAGTALLIKGATANVPVVASASLGDATNLLQAAPVTGDGSTIYVYSVNKKFQPLKSGEDLSAGKAYLVIDGAEGASLAIDFDDDVATAINGIGEAKAQATPGKVIKNGKLYIGNYNVAGQQIK